MEPTNIPRITTPVNVQTMATSRAMVDNGSLSPYLRYKMSEYLALEINLD